MTADKKPYTEIITTKPDLNAMAIVIGIMSSIKKDIDSINYVDDFLGDNNLFLNDEDVIDKLRRAAHLARHAFPTPPLAEFGIKDDIWWSTESDINDFDGKGGKICHELPVPGYDLPVNHALVGTDKRTSRELVRGVVSADYSMDWFNKIDLGRKNILISVFCLSKNNECIAGMPKNKFKHDSVQFDDVHVDGFRTESDIDRWTCDMYMKITSKNESMPAENIRMDLTVQFVPDSDHMISATCEYPDGASFTLFENRLPEPDDFSKTIESPNSGMTR